MKSIKKCVGLSTTLSIFLFFSAVSGCVSISAFALLVSVTSPAVGLKYDALTAVIKN